MQARRPARVSVALVQAAVVAVVEVVHPAPAAVPVAVPARAVAPRPIPVAAQAMARVAATRVKVRRAAEVLHLATVQPASIATRNLHVKTRIWAPTVATACHPTEAPALPVASPIRCAPAWTACSNVVAVAAASAAAQVAQAAPAAARRAALAAAVDRAAVTAADPVCRG